MNMDELENEIINSTKEFAAFNNIPFDELTQSMLLNAIRETKQKLNIHGVMQGLPIEFVEWLGEHYIKIGRHSKLSNDSTHRQPDCWQSG